MNQLILEKQQINQRTVVKITGSHAKHIREILKLGLDDSLKIGILNGYIGKGTISNLGESCSTEHDFIEVKLNAESFTSPPPALPCKLVMAMPRPKMMRRVLQHVSAMGIKEIHFIHSCRVEKSFWQTPWLHSDHIRAQLILGLEQAIDTLLPCVFLHKRFKPFVEDVLPTLLTEHPGIVAHPYAQKKCPIDLGNASSTLIIGPEGGFTEYEIEKIVDAGAQAVSIGPRILRVETAVPALISRLYPG